MTSAEAISQLKTLPDDNEEAHAVADSILLRFLRAEGYDDIVDAWLNARDNIGFWYA